MLASSEITGPANKRNPKKYTNKLERFGGTDSSLLLETLKRGKTLKTPSLDPVFRKIVKIDQNHSKIQNNFALGKKVFVNENAITETYNPAGASGQNSRENSAKKLGKGYKIGATKNIGSVYQNLAKRRESRL